MPTMNASRERNRSTTSARSHAKSTTLMVARARSATMAKSYIPYLLYAGRPWSGPGTCALSLPLRPERRGAVTSQVGALCDNFLSLVSAVEPEPRHLVAGGVEVHRDVRDLA